MTNEQVTAPADSGATGGAYTGTLSSDQQAALTLMEEVCTASGMEVHPEITSIEGSYIHIDLAGPDAAASWGRYGHSLDALQFLCNLIIAHRCSPGIRIVLDSDRYRERRAESLRVRAIELAKEVKARQEEAEIEPLPAHERRIIHAALVDDPDVSTYSEGDEPDRRVIISPKR
jgi:spoIIIJ-associated protein